MLRSATKIKIKRDLYDQLARVEEIGGYATTEEFIVHVLEREVAGLEEGKDEEEVHKQLRGLGYIE